MELQYVKQTVDYFFLQYNSWGRTFLDWLHSIFNGIFNVLLAFATLMSILYLVMSIYILLNREKDKVEAAKGNLPSVTVQIPTYNEIVALRCAEKCLELDFPEEKLEIIIGDDSNNNYVSARIDEFAERHSRIKVLRRGNNLGFKSGNLNNMLKHSKGEIIVIFDSDFIPKKDFLRKIVAPFLRDKRVAGVQSKWNFINAEQNLVSILGSTIVEVFQSVTLPFMFKQRKLAFLCGSAEAVRKDTLIELGGWDHGNLTEDIEYSLRLLKNGHRIEFVHGLECDSEVPYLPKDLYRQQMRWAYGVITSYNKHAKDILTSRRIPFQEKLYISLICSGYLLTLLLASLFVVGALTVITHPPAQIDILKFLTETGRNTLLTSGLIIASIVAVLKAAKARSIIKMIIASFSYGLIVTYHVNIGVVKAFTKRPMEWYMLTKSNSLK